jgi:ketosteroid isomerase-like protein
LQIRLKQTVKELIPFQKLAMTFFSNARYFACTVAFLLASFTCFSQAGNKGSAALVEEIRRVEKQFETDLNTRGVDFAFEKYAAPEAVIKRQNDTLIYGPQAIKQYYSTEFYKSAKAYWAPDYISVSADGAMAYTYGKYRWTFPAKPGEPGEFQGVFHTVWKRQPDGTWKYVWD